MLRRKADIRIQIRVHTRFATAAKITADFGVPVRVKSEEGKNMRSLAALARTGKEGSVIVRKQSDYPG